MVRIENWFVKEPICLILNNSMVKGITVINCLKRCSIKKFYANSKIYINERCWKNGAGSTISFRRKQSLTLIIHISKKCVEMCKLHGTGLFIAKWINKKDYCV